MLTSGIVRSLSRPAPQRLRLALACTAAHCELRVPCAMQAASSIYALASLRWQPHLQPSPPTAGAAMRHVLHAPRNSSHPMAETSQQFVPFPRCQGVHQGTCCACCDSCASQVGLAAVDGAGCATARPDVLVQALRESTKGYVSVHERCSVTICP